MKLLRSIVASLFLTGSLASAQSVHVVDRSNGAGTHFTDLFSATLAAAPGDVLLVRAGVYPERLVLREGLTIVAETGALVRLRAVMVYQLPAGQEVVLRGLTLESRMDPDLHGQDCHGTIWVDDCTFLSEPTFFSGAGVTFQNCDSVVLTRALIHGSQRREGLDLALSCFNSKLHLFDTVILANTFDDLEPVPAMTAFDSSVTLSGCTLIGGDGLDGSASECMGGPGATAALLQYTSELFAQDSTLTGGQGGLGTCGDGPPGQPVVLDPNYPPSHFSASGTPSRSLAVTSPVRDDELLRTTYEGEVGDRVWLLYSLAPGASSFPSVEGTLLVSPAYSSLFAGTIAGGPLVRNLPVPDLGAGIESLRVFAQPIFFNPQRGELVLGTPQSISVLGDAF